MKIKGILVLCLWLCSVLPSRALPLPEGATARLGTGYPLGAYFDGTHLLVVTSIAIEIWDLSQLNVQREISLHALPERACFSPTGAFLALVTDENGVSVVRLPEGEGVLSMPHEEEIVSLAFSPDEGYLAVGMMSGMISVWDLDRGEIVSPGYFRAPFDHGPRILSFSPDGKLLAIACPTHSDLYLYRWETEESGMRFPWNRWGTHSVAFSPGGDLLAIGGGDGVVRVWDIPKNKLLCNLRTASGPVIAIAFGDDVLLALGASGTVSFWDPTTWELVRELQVEGDMRYHTLVPPSTLVLHPPQGPITVWNLEEGKIVATVGIARYMGRFTDVSFSPEGNWLALSTAEGWIHIWSVGSWTVPRHELHGHRGAINALDFSPRGNAIVSGGNDRHVRVWELTEGGAKLVRELLAHTKPISDVDFAPDGSRFLTASVDETVRIWNLNTGELLHTLWKPVKIQYLQPLIRDAIFAARFSPDGDIIAAGSEDKTVRLWDTRTEKLLAVLRKHKGVVTCVEFSPDGKILASGDETGAVVLWDVKRRRPIAVLRRGGESVYSLAFSPDGTYLLVGGAEGVLELYSPQGKSLLRDLPGHLGPVFGVAFHPDGTTFVSAGGDGVALVWKFSFESQ